MTNFHPTWSLEPFTATQQTKPWWVQGPADGFSFSNIMGPGSKPRDSIHEDLSDPGATWLAMLGPPNREMTTPEMAYPRHTFDLPDAYKGSNLYLSELVVDLVTEQQAFPVNVCLPWRQYEGGMVIMWDKWIFNRRMMDQYPEEAGPRLLDSQREEHQATMLREGIGFEMEDTYMMTAEGRRCFACHLLQISTAIRETACFSVMLTLLNTEPYKKNDAKLGPSRYDTGEALKVLQRECHDFGVINKRKDGIADLLQGMQDEMRRRGVTDELIFVLPSGTKKFVQDGLRLFPEKLAGSPEAQAGAMMSGFGRIYESRVFGPGEGRQDVDPLFRNVTIGNWFPLCIQHLLNVEPENFRTAMHFVSFYSETKDAEVSLSIRDALRYCGLFEPSSMDLTELGTKFFSPYASLYDYLRQNGLLEYYNNALEGRALGGRGGGVVTAWAPRMVDNVYRNIASQLAQSISDGKVVKERLAKYKKKFNTAEYVVHNQDLNPYVRQCMEFAFQSVLNQYAADDGTFVTRDSPNDDDNRRIWTRIAAYCAIAAWFVEHKDTISDERRPSPQEIQELGSGIINQITVIPMPQHMSFSALLEQSQKIVEENHIDELIEHFPVIPRVDPGLDDNNYLNIQRLTSLYPAHFGHQFREWADQNILVPLNFINFRPHHRVGAGAAICMVPGGRTGNTYCGHANMEVGHDALRKMTLGHFTMYAKALVLENKNLLVVPNVFVNEYLNGNGHAIYTPDEITIQEYKNGNLGADIFICAVPPNWTPTEDVIDIVGRLDPSITIRGILPTTSIPSASLYAELWGWQHGLRRNRDTFFTDEEPRYNTVCFQDYYRLASYKGNGHWDMDWIAPGKTHWGANVCTGAAECRRGNTSGMVRPSYLPDSAIRIVS